MNTFDKAVLFDMDGVVLDSETLYTFAEIKLFKEYGVEIPEEDWSLFRGCSEDEFFNKTMERYNIDEEKSVIDFAFASVVTIKGIKKGEAFSKENLWVKRPGSGPLYAKDYNNIIGKEASTDIPSVVHLKPSDISS